MILSIFNCELSFSFTDVYWINCGLFDFLKIVWYYNKQSKHSLNWCIWLPSSKTLYNIKVENSGKGVRHNDSGKEDHLDHVYKVVLNINVSQVNIWIKVFFSVLFQSNLVFYCSVICRMTQCYGEFTFATPRQRRPRYVLDETKHLALKSNSPQQ